MEDESAPLKILSRTKIALGPAHPFGKSKVDIIIPFHGQYEYVAQLLVSVVNSTRSNPYQICLVDDCSPNVHFIKKYQTKKTPEGYYPNQIFTLRTPKRLGFVGALQYGFEQTSQPWVCCLQSDCLVTDPQWLFEMGRSLLSLKEKNVRMVSARTDDPGEVDLPFMKIDQSQKGGQDYILTTQDPCLPLHCFMTHRHLYSKIGGFLKSYGYGGYEDEELAVRMRRSGYKQAVCAKSWVKHRAGATMNEWFKMDPRAPDVYDSARQACLQDIQKMQFASGV